MLVVLVIIGLLVSMVGPRLFYESRFGQGPDGSGTNQVASRGNRDDEDGYKRLSYGGAGAASVD